MPASTVAKSPLRNRSLGIEIAALAALAALGILLPMPSHAHVRVVALKINQDSSTYLVNRSMNSALTSYSDTTSAVRTVTPATDKKAKVRRSARMDWFRWPLSPSRVE